MKSIDRVKKIISTILIINFLSAIIISNIAVVFATPTSLQSTPVVYPCDTSKRQLLTVGRFETQQYVTYGYSVNCNEMEDGSVSASTKIFLYAGGSYQFDYFVNACNRTTVRGKVDIYDASGTLVSHWESVKYGAWYENEGKNEEDWHIRDTGKYVRDANDNPIWEHVSIPVNQTGEFTIKYTTEYQNPQHDMGERIGFWVKDDYLVQPQYTVTCYDIDQDTGSILGTSSWKADYNSTASGANKGSSTEVGKYYTDYQYISATTATVSDNNATTVYRYFKKPIYTLTVNPNGGIWDASNAIQNFQIQYLKTKSISTPVRTGYRFTGWTLTGKNSTLNGSTFTMGNENSGLTANWQLITHNINGNVSWNDLTNKYHSRPTNVAVGLNRTPTTGSVTALPADAIVAGNNGYAFNGVQTYDTTTGNAYSYHVNQKQVVPGYETIVNRYNITNNLILPTYTSNIQYTPVGSFEDKYLRNSKVEIEANIQASSNNRDKVGLHGAEATVTIDEGVGINTNSIVIEYIKGATGEKKKITNYTVNGNTIKIPYGEGAGVESQSGDRLVVRLIGQLNQIKSYHSEISLTGKLKDYRGTNTDIDLGQVTSAERNFTVEYQMPKAKIEIVKKDSITEESLSDAKFILYEWNGTQYVAKEEIIDANQDGIYTSKEYEWNHTTGGKYKVVEEGIPLNHKDLEFSMTYTINQLKTQNYTIIPEYSNGEYRIAYGVRTPDDFDSSNGIVENEPYKVKVKLENIDSETKQQIVGDSKYVIYEWNQETGSYEKYISKVTAREVKLERQADGTYQSNEWLYYTVKNEGKYQVVQEQAAQGYYGDYVNEETKDKRSYDLNIVEVVTSKEYKGQSVDNESNIIIGNVGLYLENTRITNRVEVTKVDSESKISVAQGNGSIQGAVYEIYATEDIYHADGITSNYSEEVPGLLYKAGEKVDTQIINVEGKLSFANLESGKYYIKEKEAGEGYLLDENRYEIDVTYRGEKEKEIVETRTLEEVAKKQKFQLYKLKEKEETELEGVKDAGFSIYQVSKLSIVIEGKVERVTQNTYKLKDSKALKDRRITSKVQKDGTYKLMDIIDYYYKIAYQEGEEEKLPGDETSYSPYDMKNEIRAINYANKHEGEEIEELRSDADGYILSPELAYGEYIVIETRVPKELEAARPFIVKIEEDSRNPQKLRFIQDPNFTARVKVYKQDETSRQTVVKSGSKYIIRNIETKELVTYKGWSQEEGYYEKGTKENPYVTGEEGYFITPMELGIGKYEIEEVEAPEGYVIDRATVGIEIIGNTAYHMDDYLGGNVIVVRQADTEQIGEMTIYAEGEYITGVDKTNPDKYEFRYQKQPIQGAVFEIIAKEEIVSQDGQGRVLYAKDEVVTKLETDGEGKAVGHRLPIGKYYIKEVKAGEGFTINKEIKEFEIVYGSNDKSLEIGTKEWKESAQETEVIYQEARYENVRQKLEIEITKVDGNTKEPVEGAVFGIYAKEGLTTKTKEIALSKDELVEKVASTKEGKVEFNKELPLGEYYIKEIEAPKGYIKGTKEIEVIGRYQEDQRQKIEIRQEYENIKTNIDILKTNQEEEVIEGAVLQIVEKKQEGKDGQEEVVIKEWTTTKEKENVTLLETQKEYILREVKPAKGYVTAEEIVFKITEAGKVVIGQAEQETNIIRMIDQRSRVKIELQDKDTKELIEGASLQIKKKYQDEEGREQEEIITEFKTSKEAKVIEELEIGKYILEEMDYEEGKGYVTTSRKEFEVKDIKQEQEVVMIQSVSKVEIHLIDKETKEEATGNKMQIINEAGKIVEEWITGNKGYYIERLEQGKYRLVEKEVATNKGYVTTKEVEFKVIDTEEIQEVKMEQEETKIEIEVVDKKTKEKIGGVKVQILKKQEGTEQEEIVGEYQTKEEAKEIIRRIPQGEYIIREIQVPIDKGYVKVEDGEFTITDTQEVQTIRIEQEFTKVKVSIYDKDDIEKEEREELIGARLQIIDSNGKTKEEWVSQKEAHQIEKLPVGKYTLIQKEAPTLKGYVKAEPIEFEVKEEKEEQVVEVAEDYTKISIKIEDEEDNKEIKEGKLIIKNEKGKEVGQITITQEEDKEVLKKLPVGRYKVESSQIQEGYEKIEEIIEITGQGELQQKIVKAKRKPFDMEVKEWIEKVERNGEAESNKKGEEQNIVKVDIKDKKIQTEAIKVYYKIRITNVGKVSGEVGQVEVNIPSGMEYKEEDNKSYWKKKENNTLIIQGLAGKEISEGAYTEIMLVLRWKNGMENFGTKTTKVEISKISNKLGFTESNTKNNKAQVEVVMGVGTGEVNLIWTCIILLWILVPLELIISRRLRLKKFVLKDKSIEKYRKVREYKR